MTKIKYEYESPLDRGYKKVKLSKREHNYLFKKNNPKGWFNTFDYYISDEGFIMEKYLSVWVIILNLLLTPAYIFGYGLKAVISEYSTFFNKRATGNFIKVWIPCKLEIYKKIVRVVDS